MLEPGPDLYRVLGVDPDATAADITRAYRRRVRSALWAGPVRVEPLPAPAPRPGYGAESQGAVAARAGLVRWYPGTLRDGRW